MAHRLAVADRAAVVDRAVVVEVAHPLVLIVVPGDVDDMTVAVVASFNIPTYQARGGGAGSGGCHAFCRNVLLGFFHSLAG